MLGAIVGFGAIAQGHLLGYETSPELRVGAVVDSCEARRQVAEKDYGLSAYPDLESLLASHTVEFLDICTPPSSHQHYILEAIRRRIPAICEKPVFIPDSLPYARIVKKIVDSGVIVYPCTNYKFAPVFGEVRSIVASGALGEIRSARVRIMRRGHAVGVPEWRPDWRREQSLSAGGILRDHGPHAIYLAMSLTGLVPLSVSCIAGRLAEDGGQPWNAVEPVEDTAIARIACERGAEIEISASWASSYRDSYYVISGSRNSLTVHNDEVVFTNAGVLKVVAIRSDFDEPSHGAWFATMFADFAALLEDPAAPARLRDLLDEAALTSTVIDAAYASADSRGEWVSLAAHPARPETSGRDDVHQHDVPAG